MNNVLKLIWILSVLAAFVPEVSNTNQQSCPAITESPNTSYKYILDNIVNFSCSEQEGYQLYGQRILVCLKNGKWNHQQPVCVKEGCPPLPEIAGLQYSSHPIYPNAVITLTCGAGYIREGPSTLLCIGGSWNDVIPTCVKFENEETTCDFEERDLCGWSQDNQDKLVWMLWSGPTRTNMTGPQADHTLNDPSGTYLTVDKTFFSEPGDTAILLSPWYSPVSLATMCFSLYLHMFGEDSGNFSVYIKPETVSVTELNETLPIFFLTGNQGDQWQRVNFTVPPQSKSFQIVIVSTSVGNGIYGDVAIDDVTYAECSKSEQEISKWRRTPTQTPTIPPLRDTTSLPETPSPATVTATPSPFSATNDSTSPPSTPTSSSVNPGSASSMNTTDADSSGRNLNSTSTKPVGQTGKFTNIAAKSEASNVGPVAESLVFKLSIGISLPLVLIIFIVIISIIICKKRRRHALTDGEVNREGTGHSTALEEINLVKIDKSNSSQRDESQVPLNDQQETDCV